MTLSLVSSGDDRPLVMRDHLVPLVRAHGALEIQNDVVRVMALRTGAWTIEHWTPFSELSSEEASSPGYRHALQRQRATSELPYGLAVWYRGEKVLSMLWADDGAFKVVEFLRGPWEAEVLALQLPDAIADK